MAGSPKFSIIIPTYNAEAHVANAVKSIIQQTLANYEILVIDGASKDATLKVVKEFDDARIKIYTAPDKGVYDAMNKGLELAGGEWLYFLGSDDSLFDSKVLEDICNFSQAQKAEVIYGDTHIIGQPDWAKGEKIYGGKFTLYRLLRRNICHQGIFYKTAFVKQNKLQFNLAYPVSSDWDFNLKCWMQTSFQYINRTIANFNAGGISSDNRNADNFKQVLQEQYKEYFLAPYKSPVKRAAFKIYRQLTGNK